MPSGVIWIFTSACNLNCAHCYVKPRFSALRELSLREKLRLLDEAAGTGVEYIGFSGGEPLIHPHFPQLMKRAREWGLEVSVVTNGIAVNQRLARALARMEAAVYVSVDGARDGHESLRGPGTWEKALKGLKALLSASALVTPVMAVSKLNYAQAREFVGTVTELGAEHVALIPVMPSGRALSSRLWADFREYAHAVKAAAEKAGELGVELHLWCTPFAPLLVGAGRVRYFSCRPASVVDVDPAGRLLLCDILDVVVADAKEGFRRAIEEFEMHPLVRLVTQPELPEPCSTCPLRSSCLGGCYARALMLRGSLNAGDPLCPRVATYSSGQGRESA